MHLELPDDSFVQFDISFGCTAVSGDFYVYVEYSTENGGWLAALPTQCNPFSSYACSTWSWIGGSRLRAADYTRGWHRVTLPLPNVSGQRRVRIWAQASSAVDREWAIANLYVGGDCALGCSGHGHCRRGQCVCDAGYTLDASTGSCRPVASLPVHFEERFEGAVGEGNWQLDFTPGGAVAVSPCGPAGSGMGFFFSRSGQRLLVTRDLNTTASSYLQYAIRLGQPVSSVTCRTPRSSSYGVVVAYSVNGGVSWTVLSRLVGGYSYTTAQTLVRRDKIGRKGGSGEEEGGERGRRLETNEKE